MPTMALRGEREGLLSSAAAVAGASPVEAAEACEGVGEGAAGG